MADWDDFAMDPPPPRPAEPSIMAPPPLVQPEPPPPYAVPLDPVMAEIAMRGVPGSPQPVSAAPTPASSIAPGQLAIDPLLLAGRQSAGKAYRPEDMAHLRSSWAGEDEAIAARAVAEESEAQALGAVYAKQQAIEEASYAQADQQRREHERRQDRAFAETQAAAKDAAGAAIEAGRFWKNRSSGEKVLAAISMALGAFGSSITKTPNFAMEIINGAIAEDLEEQRSEIDAKRNRVATAGSVYTMMRQRGADEASAILADRAQKLEAVEADLRKVGAGIKGEQAQGRAAEMLAALQKARAQTLAEARAVAWQNTYARPVVGGGPDIKGTQEALAKSDEWKAWKEARAVEDEWKALSSSAPQAAIASFIAKAMKQGSFGVDFAKFVESQSWWDKAAGGINKAWGGTNEQLIGQLGRAVTAMRGQAEQRAGDVIRFARDRSPAEYPDLYTGSATTGSVAESVGVTRDKGQ